MQGNSAASTSSNSKQSGSQASTAIDPALFQKIQPAEYLARFLAEGYRPDGRRPSEFRQPVINVGSITSADGSALVQLGQTTVLCGIKAEVAQPDLLQPQSGFLVTNVDLPPMCHPKFRPGPPSDEAQVLSTRLNAIASSSKLIPRKALCIKPGRAVWVLYADIICINYDGNILDAALIALVAALKNTRLPRATWNEDLEEAVADSEELLPLKIHSSPYSASFAVAETGEVLADPTSFESDLCPTHAMVVLDEQGRIRHAWQAGPGRRAEGEPAWLLMQCIKATRERWKAINDVVQ